MYPKEESMTVVLLTKRMEIIMATQVCLISQMNINYEENGEKKSFSCNPKHGYHVSQLGELDCSTHNKKNGDYYEHLSLSHFMDEF